MSPEIVNWISRQAPGFGQLSLEERNAIADFSMIWSFFEGTRLGGCGGMRTIRRFAGSLEAQGTIGRCEINTYLPYLKQRYTENGDLNYRFHHLHIDRSGNPPEITDTLQKNNTSEKTKLIGCLGVIFRLRNNLFHGEKWQYELREQEQNFSNATSFLLKCMQAAG
ncbi:hypothetical protein ACU5P1_04960 [Pseudomonas plecoglossicida]|uniref:Uncharacterized protein n=1 Tax=Pseudomonas plecoglossicida TaxID=70775 RepID=A0AAD0R549_PSEDL|nr:hypothetical protein [Pseudomonas plecoglossicida]AXM98056.1 hypothetical protein DVB73_20885 [Pseudomonas plecoglossicida]QLB53307.1 hypothetical protein HAV28_04910 [Pseudomonas plecoglossicida]GLR38571.1 hypothetical protein GCM10011247_39690 [Pseudomonas plecoglossicida]